MNRLDKNDTKSTLSLPSIKDLIKGIIIIWLTTIFLGIIFSVTLRFKIGYQEPIRILINTLLATAILFVVSWYFVCKKYNNNILKGFALYKPHKSVVIQSIVIGLVGSLLANFLIDTYGTGKSFMDKLASTPTGLIVVMIILFLVPPFEEIYYRGFIFPILKRKIRPVFAILIIVIWFAMAHVLQVKGDWIALPIIGVMGCIWTIQRHIHKSLVPSIISHWVYNIVLILINLIAV